MKEGDCQRKAQMCLTPIEAARAENFALAASIGVKHIRALLENHPPSHLFKHNFILPTSQGRAFHTLSNNILFLQPVWAEILFTPFQAIFLFFQPARTELLHTLTNIILLLQPVWAEILLHTSSNNIFILTTSQGRAHKRAYTPSQTLFYSSS